MEDRRVHIGEVRESEEKGSMALVAILVLVILAIGIILMAAAAKYGVPPICKDAWVIILLLVIFYFASVIRDSLFGRHL